MRLLSKRWATTVLLTALACSVAFFTWRHITKPKPWSDYRSAEGAIYSLATGRTPDVGEIAVAGGFLRNDSKGLCKVVCCYEAKTGRILWEHRLAGYAELRGLQTEVGIDGNGDVFVTSHKPQTSDVANATIEKFAGATGNLIWEKNIQSAPRPETSCQMLGLIERSVIDPSGNIWLVEFLPCGNKNTPQLVVLDGRDGKEVIHRQLNGSLCESLVGVQVFRWPMQIECLADGGAIIFAVADRGRQHALRFSSTGELLSQFSILLHDNERVNPTKLRRYVDEKHRRITTIRECWSGFCSMGGEGHVHAACFSLEDGHKQWEAMFRLESPGTLAGHLPELGILRTDGDLELRSKTRLMQTETNWYRWSFHKGIPMPERRSVERSYLARTVIGGTDGAVSKTILESSSKDWFHTQALEAATATRESFVFGYDFYHYSEGRVRCPDSRRWLQIQVPEASTGKQQCFRLLKTQAGCAILARDPNDRYYRGPVHHWQLMGNNE